MQSYADYDQSPRGTEYAPEIITEAKKVWPVPPRRFYPEWLLHLEKEVGQGCYGADMICARARWTDEGLVFSIDAYVGACLSVGSGCYMVERIFSYPVTKETTAKSIRSDVRKISKAHETWDEETAEAFRALPETRTVA